MAEKVLMLALSPTMEEGTILKWNKKEGDSVEMGDVLCEVETDKASMEYESGQEGVLLKIVLGEGSPARVGDLIAVIGETGEDFTDLLAEAESIPAPSLQATEPVPTQTVGAQAPGAVPVAVESAAVVPAIPGQRIKASPLARKIAAQKGISLFQLRGTGPGGRIVKADVLEARAPLASIAGGVVSAGLSGSLQEERIPVSRMRQTIAKRLGESKFSAPHFYLKLSVGMDGLLGFRKKVNARTKEKLSLNAFFMKFAAEAIKGHREINSTWLGDSIQFHGTIDIGLAVALPTGLITPVVRGCGQKGIRQIDVELQDLIAKARKGGLGPEDYTGATFTISNLGSYGIEEFTAIINPPGSAILALGATVKTPVVTEDDEVKIKSLMKMTLSCDHRTIDGAAGAAFLADLRIMMEDPFHLLL